jgi:hypothetical protein
VSLDFTTFQIQKYPIDQIIPQKGQFDPPKFIRKYKKIKLPDKFAEPAIEDGRSFEQGLADLFNLNISSGSSEYSLSIYIGRLLINEDGKCVDYYGSVSENKKSSSYLIENKKMNLKLETWVKEQKFDTRLIPKGFDGYSFLCIVYLK